MTTRQPPRVALSPRLEAVADFVPSGARLADVGADHALLAAHVAGRDGTTVIATDRAPAAIEAARATLLRLGLASTVALRAGDGLAPLRPGEVDTIVVAGMGTRTIRRILASLPEHPGIHRLVLQPNTEVPALRRAMAKDGWAPATERLLRDDGHWYWVLSLTRDAETAHYTEADWWLGHHVRRREPDRLIEYLTEAETRWAHVRARLHPGSERHHDVDRRLHAIRSERDRLRAGHGAT